MKKTFLPLSFLLAFCYFLNGQQPVQYSMYMLNKHAFNPGYAGLDQSLSLTGVFRKQWVGLEGSPSSQQVNAHMPFYLWGGGVGINIGNDVLGAQRNTSAFASYNYQIPVKKTGILSLGVSGGIIQKSLDGTKLRAPEGTYTDGEVFNHNDNFLPLSLVTSIVPSFNLGVYFQSEKLEAGISSSNLLEPTLKLVENLTEIQLERNYFLFASYKIELSNSFTLIPSIFAKSDITQTQIEISTILNYNDNIFLGGSFRGYNSQTIDAVVMLAGVKLNEKTTLSYSFDLTLSDLNSVSKGSHEILLNYNLNKPIGKGIPPKIIYNPRFLDQ